MPLVSTCTAANGSQGGLFGVVYTLGTRAGAKSDKISKPPQATMACGLAMHAFALKTRPRYGTHINDAPPSFPWNSETTLFCGGPKLFFPPILRQPSPTGKSGHWS